MTRTLPTARHANLSFVTPRLAVGGDVSPAPHRGGAQLDEIVDLGITHIVDVRLEWDDRSLFAVRAPHIDYLHHGMDDAGQEVPPEWFEHAVQWVELALGDPSAVVLAHCHMGINRGPSLGFAVLLAQGWDCVDAIAAIRAARPQANVWYAADALDWFHQRTGTSPETARDDHARLVAWRESNPLDVVRLIRQVRIEEGEL